MKYMLTKANRQKMQQINATISLTRLPLTITSGKEVCETLSHYVTPETEGLHIFLLTR
jgi:hypothetical protein